MQPVVLAVPPWLEGTITGLLVVFVVGLIVAFYRLQMKKQSTDLGIDARGAQFQAMILKQIDDMQARNDALESRNKELNDRLAAAYDKMVERAMQHGAEVMNAVNQTRAEHADYARKADDSLKRVYAVLDETKAQLVRCEERDKVWSDTQQATAHRMEALERIVGIKAANTTLTVTTSGTSGAPTIIPGVPQT